MTAEALSAADGPPRVAPHGDAEELAEARQTVVDVVAARLVQVAEPDATDGHEAPNGVPARSDQVTAAANGAQVNTAPSDAAPPDAAPRDAAPPDAAPVQGEPAAAPVQDGAVAGPVEGGTGEPAAQLGEVPVPPAAQFGEVPVQPAAQLGEVPVQPGERPDVVGEVAEILEPAGAAGRSAATAVLDVLRASGWADTDEARALRAESDRLRELLDLVVRDHRAREASAAGLETQQHHWLVPLLRAAHGVAFGSLGAKVALRTAVQEVPERILASAGLRIDHGVEPGSEAYEER